MKFKNHTLTPGPSPVPQRVLIQESKDIIHHRTEAFSKILIEVEDKLKAVFCTKNEVILISSSGTGVMEAAVSNLLHSDSLPLVTETGVFGRRWTKIIESYNIKPLSLKTKLGNSVDLSMIEESLKTNNIDIVFTTLTETSTGVLNDVKNIAKLAHAQGSIVVVDAISGLGGQRLEMDAWDIDVVLSGSQKCLMMPPGLGFISFNKRALDRIKRSNLPKFYFDLTTYVDRIVLGQTPFTPPISLINALSESLDMILEDGMEITWLRHSRMAEAMRRAIRALGLLIFADYPCDVLTSVVAPQGIDSRVLTKNIQDKYGVTIAGGQADMSGKIFRMAHMGYMNVFDMIIGVSVIEMQLKVMGYDLRLGEGVAILEEEYLNKEVKK